LSLRLSSRRRADLLKYFQQIEFVPVLDLSKGMDQQEADDKHHRAGYAMN
jgi:hypothetical protein